VLWRTSGGSWVWRSDVGRVASQTAHV
jgi:hypothetical protein